MATYSHSARINKAYEDCNGYYMGFGRVKSKSKRIRIRYSIRNNKLIVMLAKIG